MNWMIDGAYGDHYRVAMGYRPLTPHNEVGARRCFKPKPVLGVAWATLRRAAHIISDLRQMVQTLFARTVACRRDVS
jgi:hypothetical protein